MSMNDPLGDMLDPHPQRLDARQVHGPHAGLEGPQWVLDVLQGRGLHPRLRGGDRGRPPRARDLAEVLRRPAGDPRAASASRPPAAGSIPASRRSRRSARASGSPSSRRRRASCPMHRPAPPMSAAKSCAPCSEERAMSRIGKKPVDLPVASPPPSSGQTRRGKGAEGHPLLHRDRRRDDRRSRTARSR